MILNNINKLKQFIRFIIVGGTATVMHYSIYLGLNKIGVLINVAYTIGYFISLIFNFFASSYFTFKSKPRIKRGIKFLSAHVFNYFLQIILLNIYLAFNIPRNIAPIGVFMVSIPLNYLLVKVALKDN